MHLFIPNLKNTIRKMTNCWHFVNKFLQKIFIMPRFKNHYQIWRRKKLKKERKETDYQRRYKNEWIAPQNIYTVLWNPANIYFFYIQKLSFHYSPFCTRIKQKFYGEQFFQDHKTFHQLPNWLSPDNVNDFFWEGDSLSRKVILTRVVISRGGTSAKLWVDIYCLAVWSLA